MGILISVALLSAVFFAVTVTMRTVVGALGGEVPAFGPVRQAAHVGQARLARIGLDREYRDLFGR